MSLKTKKLALSAYAFGKKRNEIVRFVKAVDITQKDWNSIKKEFTETLSKSDAKKLNDYFDASQTENTEESK